MDQIRANYQKNIYFKVVSGLVLIGLVVLIVFSTIRYQRSKDPNYELALIIKQISQTIELPQEPPTLATVTNRALLAQQEFFRRAENGDKVLIFKDWRKIILYRPSTKKIIDIATISADQANEAELNPALANESPRSIPTSIPSSIPSPTPQPELHRVAIFNGTTINGLTQTASDKLSENSQISITVRQNASKNDYTQTLIIPLKEASTTVATNLARLLSGQISTLPAHETAPVETDILVILGSSESTPSTTQSIPVLNSAVEDI